AVAARGAAAADRRVDAAARAMARRLQLPSALPEGRPALRARNAPARRRRCGAGRLPPVFWRHRRPACRLKTKTEETKKRPQHGETTMRHYVKPLILAA